MEPAQPITTHGHTDVCECPGGHGITLTAAPAKAVSVGSQPVARGMVPQEGSGSALICLIGIIEGAKNNIAPINMVLTIFRTCLRIAAPSVSRYAHNFAGVTVQNAPFHLRRQCG
jgi:hypothetical protein